MTGAVFVPEQPFKVVVNDRDDVVHVPCCPMVSHVTGKETDVPAGTVTVPSGFV
jgi:hypothetical protein